MSSSLSALPFQRTSYALHPGLTVGVRLESEAFRHERGKLRWIAGCARKRNLRAALGGCEIIRECARNIVIAHAANQRHSQGMKVFVGQTGGDAWPARHHPGGRDVEAKRLRHLHQRRFFRRRINCRRPRIARRISNEWRRFGGALRGPCRRRAGRRTAACAHHVGFDLRPFRGDVGNAHGRAQNRHGH